MSKLRIHCTGRRGCQPTRSLRSLSARRFDSVLIENLKAT